MTMATIGLTPAEMARRLTLYRSAHAIEPTCSTNHGTFGHGTGLFCGPLTCRHDGIRLLPKQGGWRHDPDEIKSLSERADQRLLAELQEDR